MAWWNSKALHNVIPAGRRSYKSETAKRKLVMGSTYKPGALTLDDAKFFYAAPTFKQAKRLAWNDLKAMTLPFHKGKPSESELVIPLKNNSEIWLLGMDVPERAEGSQWHGGIMDEYGNMHEEVWTEHLQPVTSDTNAWVDFIGVPEGRNHYYELWLQSLADPDMAGFTWKSADVLDAAVIERAMRLLDPRTFRQEYEASFETSTVTAYYTFTTEGCVGQFKFDPLRPCFMAWDFNAGSKPMATVLIQQTITGAWAVVKEFVTPMTNTEAQAQAVDDWLRGEGFKGTLEVCGDYAGKRRESSASFSDYEIIEQRFKNYPGYKSVMRPTLSVKDRVASTNAMILNAKSERRLYVDESCTALRKDLQRVEWKANGVELDDRKDELTHVSDALSYWAYNYFPIDSVPRSISVN